MARMEARELPQASVLPEGVGVPTKRAGAVFAVPDVKSGGNAVGTTAAMPDAQLGGKSVGKSVVMPDAKSGTMPDARFTVISADRPDVT